MAKIKKIGLKFVVMFSNNQQTYHITNNNYYCVSSSDTILDNLKQDNPKIEKDRK